MEKKKGLFGGLFKGKKESGCCNIEIIEEEETEKNAQCCDGPKNKKESKNRK